MEAIFLHYAKMIPETIAILELVNAIDSYTKQNNDATKKQLKVSLMLLITKFQIENKDIYEVIKDFEQKKNIIDTFSPLNNPK